MEPPVIVLLIVYYLTAFWFPHLISGACELANIHLGRTQRPLLRMYGVLYVVLKCVRCSSQRERIITIPYVSRKWSKLQVTGAVRHPVCSRDL